MFEPRMRRILEATGTTSDSELARALGIQPPSVAGARQRKLVPMGWIEKIASDYNISADWLLFGRGPMRPADSLDQPQANLIHPAAPPSQADCPRCAKLEAKLEKVEQQRDVLVEENRKLWEKNSELITMNGKLNTQVAKLEAEVQKPGIYKQDIAQTGVA